MKVRVGLGYDVHRFLEGRTLWLGGIKIDFPKGLEGHSDADVVIHSICDALLGAANLGDIGLHFPDTSSTYKNIDSKVLLAETAKLIRNKGYEIGNIDVTVCAEEPKLKQHIPLMKTTLAKVLAVDEDDVSIKATTTEKLGFVGRQEGIASQAVALLSKA